MSKIICLVFFTLALCSGCCAKDTLPDRFESEVDRNIEKLYADGVVAKEDFAALKRYVLKAYSFDSLLEMSVSDVDSAIIDDSKFQRLVRNISTMSARIYLKKKQGSEFAYHELFKEGNGFEVDWIISLIDGEVEPGKLDAQKLEKLYWVEGDRIFHFSNQTNLGGWVSFRQGQYVSDFRVVGRQRDRVNSQLTD